MAWPLSQDYNEAIQAPASSFNDSELKAGDAVTNALGMPMPRSGNFADVYEFNTPATQGKWAIKCFTRHVVGLRERYTEISASLLGAKLPFAVDFQYLVQGIRIKGDWFPILKMRWVEGLLLNELVRNNLDKPAVLEQLTIIWCRMARRLREAGIAHADLQHGNVILVPGSKTGSLAVKLIDYDGMFVPALASKKSGEVGHPNYQHPQRLREGNYNADVDRFPLLVVATALRALAVVGADLWTRYDNGDNLLFRESDLKEPGKSPLFAELHKINDPQVRMLTEELQKAAERDLAEAPKVDELLPEAKATKPASMPVTPRPAEKETPEPAVAARTMAPLEFDDVRADGASRPKAKGMPTWVWLSGGGVLAVGLLGVVAAGIAAMLVLGGGTPTKDKVKQVAQEKEKLDKTKRAAQEKEKPDNPKDGNKKPPGADKKTPNIENPPLEKPPVDSTRPPEKPAVINGVRYDADLNAANKKAVKKLAMGKTFDIAKSWALSAEVYFVNAVATDRLVVFWGDDRPGRDAMFLRQKGETLEATVGDTVANTQHAMFIPLPQKSFGAWLPIVFSYHAPTKELQVFLDGALVKKERCSFTPALDQPMPIWLGGGNLTYQRFNGKIRALWLANLDLPDQAP